MRSLRCLPLAVFLAGTRAHKFAQGKELVFMKQDKAQMIDKLSREYGKILGFDSQ